MTTEIETLLKQLSETTEQKEKGQLLNVLAEKYFTHDPSLALNYSQQALNIFENIDEKIGILNSKLNIIYCTYENLDYETSLRKCTELEDEVYKFNDNRLLYKLNKYKGLINFRLSNFDVALSHFYKCVEIGEQDKNILEIAGASLNIGNIYMELGEYETSMAFYMNTLAQNEQIKNRKGIFSTKGNIANLLSKLNRNEEAIREYEELLSMPEATDNPATHARVLSNLGSLYLELKRYFEAELYYTNAYSLNSTGQNNWGLTISLMGLGKIALENKKYDKAEKLLNDAFEICIKSHAKTTIYLIHKLLSRLYQETDDYKKALYHYQQYSQLKDEVFSKEKNQKINLLKTQALEKEKEIERLKNVELKKAHDDLEEKNKEITSSINYASYIQLANFPSNTKVKYVFPDRIFFLLKAKDIVAGDFFWIGKYGDKSLVAAIDCTGHGIPGALLTMIANELLNTATENLGIYAPGAVLNYLNRSIRKKFNEGLNSSKISLNDGMDIAFCAFDFKNLTLEYAGANRPLFLVRNGELLETPPTKYSIGGHTPQNQIFENHFIKLEEGDSVYLFSDGYADQFGMPEEDWKKEEETRIPGKRKKLMMKKFKQLLIEIHGKTQNEKLILLRDYFNNWKGNESQTDDMLIVGVNVVKFTPDNIPA